MYSTVVIQRFCCTRQTKALMIHKEYNFYENVRKTCFIYRNKHSIVRNIHPEKIISKNLCRFNTQNQLTLAIRFHNTGGEFRPLCLYYTMHLAFAAKV